MTTSRQADFLSEVLKWKRIPEDTLIYFQDRLRRSIYSVLLDAYTQRSIERDLTKKELARRIRRSAATVNRWLIRPSNLSLDSISLIMIGLAMDFDGFPFTPIEKSLKAAEREQRRKEEEANLKQITEKIERNLRAMLATQVPQIIESLKESEVPSGASITPMPSSPIGATQTANVPSASRGSERQAHNHIRRLVGEHYA